jgi:hypothetical protein
MRTLDPRQVTEVLDSHKLVCMSQYWTSPPIIFFVSFLGTLGQVPSPSCLEAPLSGFILESRHSACRKSKNKNFATCFSNRTLDSRWTTVLVSLELFMSSICFLLHKSQPCRQSTKDMDTVWKGSRVHGLYQQSKIGTENNMSKDLVNPTRGLVIFVLPDVSTSILSMFCLLYSIV